MEFTYTDTIYFDIDYLVISFVENWSDNNLIAFLKDYVIRMDDYDYYHVESYMLDKVQIEMMKYEAVKAKVNGD